jgi:GDP-L-fucose synthase
LVKLTIVVVIVVRKKKAHEAKVRNESYITVWGTGTLRREFLNVDDLADACIYLMKAYSGSEPVNIGVGEDIGIGELAELVCEVVGYRGGIVYDTTKPDGTPRRLLNVSKLHSLGWQAKFPLREGIEQTYSWYTKMCSEEHAKS